MIEVYTKNYWLNELSKSALFLESLYRKPSWNEGLEFETEKAVFLGFYTIRKLKESKLLCSEISGFNTKLVSYPIRADVKLADCDKWSEAYNLMQGNEQVLALEELCNQFIHSKIYSPFVPGGLGCMGFYFASDKEFKSHVYYVTLVKIVSVFLSVSNSKKINLKLDINGAQIGARNINDHT